MPLVVMTTVNKKSGKSVGAFSTVFVKSKISQPNKYSNNFYNAFI